MFSRTFIQLTVETVWLFAYVDACVQFYATFYYKHEAVCEYRLFKYRNL